MGVTKYKHTYILTFNKPVIPKDIMIGYCLKKVEHMSCFKYHKYGHYKESSKRFQYVEGETKGKQTTWKKMVNENKCLNFKKRNYPDFSRSSKN